MSEAVTNEPVMSTYMEKWSKVNVVAHEQERSAREEYSRACIDWQRIEIGRLIREVERLREALEMVQDADEDCIRDGLTTIPHAARAKIDAALAPLPALNQLKEPT